MKNYEYSQSLGFDMQDIIHELLEIDADAQKLTAEALAKRRDVRRIIDEGIAELKKRLQKEAQEQVESYRQSRSESVERSIAAVREKCAKAVVALRAAYEKHGDMWVEDIFRATISRE